MNVLAVGAHPDDVEYGCGGYLARLAAAGADVLTVVATRGERGGDETVRASERQAATQHLGLKAGVDLWLPDGAVDDSHAVVDRLEALITHTHRDCILVNTPDDSHQDHRAIARATLAAARRVPRVLCYHAPSSTRVMTRVLCADIGPTIQMKLDALAAYVSQARHRLVELAEAEALFWGGRTGVRYAEAFEPVRWLL